MKRLTTLVLALLLLGCAADPQKLEDVAKAEVERLPKPSVPLSSFSDYDLKPSLLSDAVKDSASRVAEAAILDQKIRDKVVPLFADWSSSGGSGRAGTLIVQPEIVSLRIVSGGARFWAGALAGSSHIDLDLALIDGKTGAVIEKARIRKEASAMTGGWSIGKSDENLHDYVAHIVHRYLLVNY